MRMSDIIAEFIKQTLDAGDGVAEVQRSELAERFNCVPSQINYVIETRFSPERGFSVESRRGGGGYIRIRRIAQGRPQMIMHLINSIGMDIDERTAGDFILNLADAGIVSMETARAMLSAVAERALVPVPAEFRPPIRARILKSMLASLM